MSDAESYEFEKYEPESDSDEEYEPDSDSDFDMVSVDNSEARAVIRAATGALSLIDQFHVLVLRLIGRGGKRAPTVAMPGEGDTLEIWHGETIVEIVTPAQVDLDSWDNTRFCALSHRIRSNWEIMNNLWAQEPLMGPEERARASARLSGVRNDLCFDVEEALRMCERALDTRLPEHKNIAEICQRMK
jgi:hypothetical protein